MRGKGLFANALPTARAPFGLPKCVAMSLYVLTLPRGIPCSARSIRCWNSPHKLRPAISRENSTESPWSSLLIPEATALISAQEAVRTFGYSSDTRLSADNTGFESKTRMIVGPRPVVVQMIPTSPKGVDLIIFLFMPYAFLFIFWVERWASPEPKATMKGVT